jgi:TRAP-type C4-dicarboxylate transport system permease small subunit
VDRLARVLDLPINLMMWLACFVGLLMMLHITADVTGRVIFNYPLEGTIEIVSGYYMVAISFLPLAYISRHEGHIAVELFTRGLAGHQMLRLEVIVNIVTVAYLAVFTWKTGEGAYFQTVSREVWETATGFVSMWPSRWALPIGTGVMAIYLILRIFLDIRNSARS